LPPPAVLPSLAVSEPVAPCECGYRCISTDAYMYLHILHVHMQTRLVRERPVATSTHEHARYLMCLVHVRAEILVACNSTVFKCPPPLAPSYFILRNSTTRKHCCIFDRHASVRARVVIW
jgi:hypothetical protein